MIVSGVSRASADVCFCGLCVQKEFVVRLYRKAGFLYFKQIFGRKNTVI